MDVAAAGKGSIYNIKDLQGITDKSRHNYLVIGGNESSILGSYQTMNITSMYGHAVTYEVPVMFKNRVGYIVPYNIYSYKKYTWNEDASYQGSLTGDIEGFISLLINVYTDVTINNFSDRKFHAKVELQYNEYVKKFYSQHKGAQEYRYTKDASSEESPLYKPVLYGGKPLLDIPENVVRFIVNKTKPDEMSDADVVACYKTLKNIHQSEFNTIVPGIQSKQYFYNRRREFKQAIINRPNVIEYLVN
jgi:hypothetical protein